MKPVNNINTRTPILNGLISKEGAECKIGRIKTAHFKVKRTQHFKNKQQIRKKFEEFNQFLTQYCKLKLKKKINKNH